MRHVRSSCVLILLSVVAGACGAMQPQPDASTTTQAPSPPVAGARPAPRIPDAARIPDAPRIPDAAESDPGRLGWMQGFPPPPDKQIGQPDADFFSFPKLRWSVCHLRELLPTEQVSRGLGNAKPLAVALDEGIDAVRFRPLGSDTEMTWQESLAANYTDGVLVLHGGRRPAQAPAL